MRWYRSTRGAVATSGAWRSRKAALAALPRSRRSASSRSSETAAAASSASLPLDDDAVSFHRPLRARSGSMEETASSSRGSEPSSRPRQSRCFETTPSAASAAGGESRLLERHAPEVATAPRRPVPPHGRARLRWRHRLAGGASAPRRLHRRVDVGVPSDAWRRCSSARFGYRCNCARYEWPVVAEVAKRRSGARSVIVPAVPRMWHLRAILAHIRAMRNLRPDVCHVISRTPYACK